METDLGNYLTMAADNPRNAGYEVKMFAGSGVPGFVEMRVLHIDEKNVYQYKVAGYDSFLEYHNRTNLQKKDLRKLIVSIMEICSRVSEFLLNIDCVILRPEQIFLCDEKLFFCYYPDDTKKFKDDFKCLMEYVLEHIDHNDRESVMIAYGIYQKILKNNYTLESLLETFEEKNEKPNEEAKEIVSYQKTPVMECVREVSSYQVSEANSVFFEEEPTVWEKLKGLLARKGKERDDKDTKEGTMLLSAPKLVNLCGGEDIILTHFPFVIGSLAKKSDYAINNPLISRKHAIIWNENGSIYLEDVGSTNGTKLNGVAIPICEKVLINQGMEIEFANIKYRFE